jgi:hypothetical protein
MNTSVTAIFQDGALRPVVPLELAEGTCVELIILTEPNGMPVGDSAGPVASPMTDAKRSNGREQARAAFLRDLPHLLDNPRHEGWWAAYHGDLRLGVGKSPQDLLREIQRQGISKDSYYLGVIRPHEPEVETIEPRHGHHFDTGEFAT